MNTKLFKNSRDHKSSIKIHIQLKLVNWHAVIKL